MPKTKHVLRTEISQNFKECWGEVHQQLFSPVQNAQVTDTQISLLLREMVDMLIKEQSLKDADEVGPCMEFVLRSDLMQILCDVSSADSPAGLMSETLKCFGSLVTMLDDDFLVPYSVHRPVVKLIRTCVKNQRHSTRYEAELVEFIFAVCSKIRLYPNLLNVFFFDRRMGTSATAADPHMEGIVEYEFVLFDYLLRFIHREGTIGDAARTSVMFLLELDNPVLENYIWTSSDYSKIISAGLGALYSHLVLSCNSTAAEEEEHLTSLEMSAFLKFLIFCNATIEVIADAEVANHLCSQVRSIFLNNVVLPSALSLLQSKEVPSLVFKYMEECLSIVDHRLGDMFVGFLLERNEVENTCFRQLLLHELGCVDTWRFKSALILLNAMLDSHPRTVFDLLFSCDVSTLPFKPQVATYFQIVDRFVSLLGKSNRANELSVGYEDYLKEAEVMVASKLCKNAGFKKLTLSATSSNASLNFSEPLSIEEPLRLAMEQFRDDPVLELVLSKISQLFTLPLDAILALTAFVSHLTSMSNYPLFLYLTYGDALLPDSASTVFTAYEKLFQEFSLQEQNVKNFDYYSWLVKSKGLTSSAFTPSQKKMDEAISSPSPMRSTPSLQKLRALFPGVTVSTDQLESSSNNVSMKLLDELSSVDQDLLQIIRRFLVLEENVKELVAIIQVQQCQLF